MQAERPLFALGPSLSLLFGFFAIDLNQRA